MLFNSRNAISDNGNLNIYIYIYINYICIYICENQKVDFEYRCEWWLSYSLLVSCPFPSWSTASNNALGVVFLAKSNSVTLTPGNKLVNFPNLNPYWWEKTYKLNIWNVVFVHLNFKPKYNLQQWKLECLCNHFCMTLFFIFFVRNRLSILRKSKWWLRMPSKFKKISK